MDNSTTLFVAVRQNELSAVSTYMNAGELADSASAFTPNADATQAINTNFFKLTPIPFLSTSCRIIPKRAHVADYFVLRKNLRISSALLQAVNSAAASGERSARLKYAMSCRYGLGADSGAIVRTTICTTEWSMVS